MSFEPYIKPHGIGDLRFFFATPEARAWYDPLKPYTKLEYEWVQATLNIENQVVIDAGCHHGNYGIVFGDAWHVWEIDCVESFLDIAEINFALNEFHHRSFHHKRLSKGHGAKFIADAEKNNAYKTTIYKMDIEGSEFELMPEEIDDFPSVHTWIVEIHPNAGDPNMIARAFADRQFELLKVDRERMVVRPYELGERWLTHATLIARRA